jgi:hypothetical protein
VGDIVFGRLGADHCLSGGEEAVIWVWGGIFLGLLRRYYLVAIIFISIRSQRDDILSRSVSFSKSKPTH